MSEPRYLLDTNILSNVLRKPAGPAAERIRQVGEDAVCTSIVVACEMRYGAAKRRSAALSERVNQLLSAIEVFPLNGDADKKYGETRAALEEQGTPIGANDCLIAAHALSRELILVTDNVSEFSRVQGLTIENWLRP